VIPVSCDDQEDILINVEKSFRRKTGQRKGSDESAQPLLCNETSSWEEKGKCGEEENVRYFVHCYRRFQYNPLTERAIPIIGLAKQTCQGFCESKGLTDEQVLKRREMYGENVAAVEVTPYLHLFVSEVLNPFYVFQWVTVIFWCLDEYYYYSGAILFISFLSLGISLHQTRKQLEELRKMAPEPVHLTVQRNGGHTTVASNELVPGDLVEIPAEESFEMPCDAVLVCGTCRVNESMLTGETIHIY
jgi:magnesium-transporting ATPase (P-type)